MPKKIPRRLCAFRGDSIFALIKSQAVKEFFRVSPFSRVRIIRTVPGLSVEAHTVRVGAAVVAAVTELAFTAGRNRVFVHGRNVRIEDFRQMMTAQVSVRDSALHYTGVNGKV